MRRMLLGSLAAVMLMGAGPVPRNEAAEVASLAVQRVYNANTFGEVAVLIDPNMLATAQSKTMIGAFLVCRGLIPVGSRPYFIDHDKRLLGMVDLSHTFSCGPNGGITVDHPS